MGENLSSTLAQPIASVRRVRKKMFQTFQPSNNPSICDCGSEQKCLLGFHSSDDFSRFWLQRQSENTEMKDIHERIQYEVDHLVANVKYFQSHHSQKTSALADTTAGLLPIYHDNNNCWIRLNFDVTCGSNKVPGDTGVPCDHVDLCGRLPRRYF